MDYLLTASELIGFMLYLSMSIYLIRRAWLQADYDTIKGRKVCDICLKDIKRLNEFLKN